MLSLAANFNNICENELIKTTIIPNKFSYEEIYHEVAEKFVALNKEMPLRAITQLRECLDKFISDGYLNECAGMYYPTVKKKSVKQKVVVE